MKLITLRIDEVEKARLEHLAQRGNVTLSRALREGAGLYLADLQAKAHRKRGQDATFLGIRRDKAGRAVNERSQPTEVERAAIESLRATLYEHGLAKLRALWDHGGEASVVLASLGSWLSLVGQIYAGNGDEAGWHWFLIDYCHQTEDEAADVRRSIRSALVREPETDISALFDRLDAGFRRFVTDVETQELVRREVLPAWEVLRGSL